MVALPLLGLYRQVIWEKKCGAQNLYESQLATQGERVFQFGEGGERFEAEVNRERF